MAILRNKVVGLASQQWEFAVMTAAGLHDTVKASS
jgi:hypothetical protein